MCDSCVSFTCPPAMFVVVMLVALCFGGGAWRMPSDREVDRKFHAWSMLDNGAPVVAMSRPIRRYVDKEAKREMEMRIPEGNDDGDGKECQMRTPTEQVCNFTDAPVPSRLPARLTNLTELEVHKAERLQLQEDLCLERLNFFNCKQIPKVYLCLYKDLRPKIFSVDSSFDHIVGRYSELDILQSVIQKMDIYVTGERSHQNHITNTTIKILRSSTNSTASLHTLPYGGINVDSGSLVLLDVNVTELGRGGFNVTDRGELFLNNVSIKQSSSEGIILSGRHAVVSMTNLRVGGVIRNARFESFSESLLIHPLRMFRPKEPPVSKTLAIMLCLLGFLLGILLGSLGTYLCCAMRLTSGKIQMNVPDEEADGGASGGDSERIQGVSYLPSNQSVQVTGRHKPEETLQSSGEDPRRHNTNNGVLHQNPDYEPLYEDTDAEPLYEDTNTEPLYQDTGAEPLYQDTDTEPLYEETDTEPFYQDTDTEPLYEDTNEEPLYQDAGELFGNENEEPIYGNIWRPEAVETTKYGAIHKDTRNLPSYKGTGDGAFSKGTGDGAFSKGTGDGAFSKGTGDGASYKDTRDEEPLYDTTDNEPIYGNLSGEPDKDLQSPQEPTLDQEEPIYGNIGAYACEELQRPHEQASTTQYSKDEDEEIYENI